MAKKIKLTRPELHRYRNALQRYQHYLPMLKLKQQQLQLTLRDVDRERREADEMVRDLADAFGRYDAVLADVAGLNVTQLAKPDDVKTSLTNIAGISVPVFDEALFPTASYSLFGTPVWVDRALADLRELRLQEARLAVLKQQYALLHRELTRIIQRVNLFEKIKIPEAQEAVRVIRIRLGDEMTAAVGRAKITKSKLEENASANAGEPTG